MTEELKTEELKLNEQPDGSLIVGDLSQDENTNLNAPPEDERLGTHTDEPIEDEVGHENETPEDAEARRLRNRERRAQNKGRRKDFIATLQREIASRDEIIQDAMQRLEAVEKRGQGADFAALDQEIQKTNDAYNYFKQQIDLGTREQNGAVVADATEKMITARQRGEQLSRVKQMAKQRQMNPPTPPLDPRVKTNAESWLSRNSWYDIDAKDEDSFLVKQIDNRLAQEGFNPTTEVYWQELDARVKRILPHRSNSGYNRSTQTPRSPVAGSERDRGSTKGGSGYVISAERVQALKDAGIYDDPKQRAEAVRRFQEYDAKQKA